MRPGLKSQSEHGPLACAPSGVALRCEGEAIDNGQNVRWAHRPEVYVPSQSFGLLAAQARGLRYDEERTRFRFTGGAR
jgi:hypothetical protein